MPKRSGAVTLVVALAAVAAAAWLGFFFFRDNFSTHYPVKVLSAASFRSFEIPYWNFHSGGGQPVAGNPNMLSFYPDNALYLLLPAHVAFNLHFLLHLGVAWLAMRALVSTRGGSRAAAHFAATVYALSGVAISATAFYNLTVTVAVVPLALLAVERRSARLLGVSFGLLLLAAEPVSLIGAAIAVAIAGFGKMRWTSVAVAVGIALAIGSPQLIAWGEIAAEVERLVSFPAPAVLVTSLTATRIAELFAIPWSASLMDGGGVPRLFSTVFLGIIALPALFRRSRYTIIAAAMVFLAAGRFNPVVVWLVTNFEATRVARYPEKFAIPLVAALVVLVAMYFDRTRFRRVWLVVTIVPLLWTTYRALPVDWYEPYRVAAPVAPRRVQLEGRPAPPGMDARSEYRMRARNLEPIFGAVAGRRYALNGSPDNMHSILSAVVQRRFENSSPELRRRYLRLLGCDVPAALPPASLPRRTVPARSLGEAVAGLEDPSFDEREAVVVPADLALFRPAPGRVTRYAESGQSIHIDLTATGETLLFVNQSYFAAWVARAGGAELETLPLNVDRLGVRVPAGVTRVELRFGRRRGVVAAAWIASALLLAVALFREAVEERDRRASEVERAADENGLLA